jgi:hypothetical protein
LTVPSPRPGRTQQPGRSQQAGRPQQAGGQDERHPGFRRVRCDRCGATVQAAKFSPQHTIVQWDAVAVRACAEFRDRAAAGEPSALIEGCASVRDSIDRAVLEGHLEVSPP